MRALAAGICLLGFMGLALAGNEKSPFQGDGRAIRAGAKLYRRECASCHGKDRAGHGKAPPLLGDQLRSVDDARLFSVLRDGKMRHGMPSFAHLPEAQRWQIIAFLRSE